MNQYQVVEDFEEAMAEYCGSSYAVAVDSCTNAIKLSLVYNKLIQNYRYVTLPKHTYVGVAYSVLNVPAKCRFIDAKWRGDYPLITYGGLGVIDSARRLYNGCSALDGMAFRCLSFHETKHLPIGRGGMILTNNGRAANMLREMRFDGRTAGVPPKYDTFTYPAFHCHMKPDDAARGLMLMANLADHNEDLPNSDYGDLSEHKIFTDGYSFT